MKYMVISSSLLPFRCVMERNCTDVFLSRSFCSSGLRVLREWDECRRYDFYGHKGYFPLLAFHELSRIRQQSGRAIGKTDCRGCLFFYPVCSESCEGGGCRPIISDWVSLGSAVATQVAVAERPAHLTLVCPMACICFSQSATYKKLSVRA